jgi:hypothetical protein
MRFWQRRAHQIGVKDAAADWNVEEEQWWWANRGKVATLDGVLGDPK